MGAASFALAELGMALASPAGVMTFGPANGLLLAALLHAPRRSWPELLAAALVAQLASLGEVHGSTWIDAFVVWLRSAFEACLGALAIARIVGGPLSMGRLRDVTVLVLVTTGLSTPLAAAGSAFALGDASAGAFLESWRAAWLADQLGVLAACPLLLSFADGSARPRASRWALLELLALLGLIGVASHLTFSAAPLVRLPRGIPALALMWTAFRFGPRGGSLGMALMTVTVLAAVARSEFSMPSLGATPQIALWELQGFLSLSFASVLILAALSEERVRIGRLESEVHALRGLLPICAHCKKIRDEAGAWHSVEAYVEHHSEATFSHGVCPVCLETHYGDLLKGSG